MQEEKNRIERVLGAISAPDLIQKVLNFALSVCTNPFFESLREYKQRPYVFSFSSLSGNELLRKEPKLWFSHDRMRFAPRTQYQ